MTAQQIGPDRRLELLNLRALSERPKFGKERVQIGKERRIEQREQRPELGRVVLQRRAREQQQVLGRERSQLRRDGGIFVLESVRFVHHDASPRDRT